MIRKIKTWKETKKKNRKNQIILGAVLIGILVISTAGFALYNKRSEENSVGGKYGDLDFIRVGGFWELNLQGVDFYFQYLPQELENVSFSGFYDFQKYSGKPLYFVNDNIASGEILNNLGDYISRYQKACLNSSCDDETLPIKTCEDNIVIFNVSESDRFETRVHSFENCVYIEGDYIRGADAFIYKLLGII